MESSTPKMALWTCLSPSLLLVMWMPNLGQVEGALLMEHLATEAEGAKGVTALEGVVAINVEEAMAGHPKGGVQEITRAVVATYTS